MPETHGYVRTSRPRVSELSGSDPETQRQQLLAAGVALSHIVNGGVKVGRVGGRLLSIGD